LELAQLSFWCYSFCSRLLDVLGDINNKGTTLRVVPHFIGHKLSF
jgi:hypothetical protein